MLQARQPAQIAAQDHELIVLRQANRDVADRQVLAVDDVVDLLPVQPIAHGGGQHGFHLAAALDRDGVAEEAIDPGRHGAGREVGIGDGDVAYESGGIDHERDVAAGGHQLREFGRAKVAEQGVGRPETAERGLKDGGSDQGDGL